MTLFQGALLRDKPDGHSRERPRNPTFLRLVDEGGEAQRREFFTQPLGVGW